MQSKAEQIYSSIKDVLTHRASVYCSWRIRDCSPSSCMMPCQHQPYYISLHRVHKEGSKQAEEHAAQLSLCVSVLLWVEKPDS